MVRIVRIGATRVGISGEIFVTPAEFKRIRESLGLTAAELAVHVGYSASRAKLRIEEIEAGKKPIPRYLDMLMTAYAEGYVPKGGFRQQN